MALTLRDIRENTSAARELMLRARAEKFAVGAFNLDNQETLKAVSRAAVTKKSPVIVEVSHDEAQSIGLENLRDMVDNYKSELGIEIYLNLDHSPSLEAAIAGIENGFEFIHLDMSHDPEISGEEIIENTKFIVNYARLTGALVEAEPQYFIPPKDEKAKWEDIKRTFSTPEGARQFVEATGADIYAAGIGNLHEKLHAPKTLDIDLLKHIREVLDCNISLHGGSGIPEHYFIDAVNAGVSKVNINYDMRVAFRNSLEKVLKENPDELSFARLTDDIISAVQKVVEEKIDMLGSAGKAKT